MTEDTVFRDASLRGASPSDAPSIHRLISDNVDAGHLLPRDLEEVARHAGRFVVAEVDGRVMGCAELAPLSREVAEVRSLVVADAARRRGIGASLVREIASAGLADGFAALCAFTHDPAPFVRLGFTLVPHTWVPEKIAHDCTSCTLFRRCGQYAVTLPLSATAVVRPERPAALIHGGRGAAARRLSVERLRLPPAAALDRSDNAEAIPA